jgi:hypothetical protein
MDASTGARDRFRSDDCVDQTKTFASNMDDQEEIRRLLDALRSEHRDLDLAISRIVDSPPFDQLHLQRLKKRKLILKDRIAILEDQLLPDIIA